MADFNLNQFQLQHSVGDLDLNYFGGMNVVSVLFNPTDTTHTVAPGVGVKLTDLGSSDIAGGVPIVALRSAATDSIFGIRIRNTKAASTAYNNVMEIAILNSVVYMKATAAFLRGAKLTLDTAQDGYVKAKGTDTLVGIALDKASAVGDLVRVWVKAEGYLADAIVMADISDLDELAITMSQISDLGELTLNDLKDVAISSPADTQTIKYEASSALWKNAASA